MQRGVFRLVAVGLGLAAFAGIAATAMGVRAQKPRRLVIVAGKPSHPPGMHEFNAGGMLLKKCLENVKGLEVVLYKNGWPSDPKAFEGADAVFMYSDGGSGHMALQGENLKQLTDLAAKGVGIGAAHYAVEVPKERGGAEWQALIGGYYETYWSCNPIWEPQYENFPRHPITRGVKPFRVKDEWYMHMRFRPEMQGVKPILVASPPDEVRDGPYVSPRGPYPHIQADKGKPEIMMWCVERPDGGRGFGFTGGHFHVNWGNENYRKTVLNALLWISKVPVPRDGVVSTVTEEELKENLDPKGR
jgi:type 1 glutamine amidotransferase